MPSVRPLIFLFALFAFFANTICWARSPFDAAPIFYSDTQPSNKISELQQALSQHKVQLDYDERFGYLPSLLKLLEIPLESQGLVFSKTSLQRRYITPKNPRAIYFNDDVYIGSVHRGDVIEISVSDPKLGTVFYTLDQKLSEKPVFNRQVESCMLCHSSSGGYRVPGHVVQSMQVNGDGYPLTGSARYRTDHTSPMSERWGGWYVAGELGKNLHMGNKLFESYVREPHLSGKGKLTKLGSAKDNQVVLTQHSDVVALMVLEHQTLMHNVLTAASFETRKALYEEKQLRDETTDLSYGLLPLTQLRIKNAAENVVNHLLFVDEAELLSPILGSTQFLHIFSSRGVSDTQGRHLRQFDLNARLFKYPCSYLIYSQSFKALPKELKNAVYLGLKQVLNSDESNDEFSHLSVKDKKAIRDILVATLPELAKAWRVFE